MSTTQTTQTPSGRARLGVLGLLLALSAAGAKTVLAPAGLETFDGTKWAGLALGQTKLADLRSYAVGRGDSPSSIEMVQPKGSAVRVQALFPDTSATAQLALVRIGYKPGTLNLSAVRTAAGAPGEDRFLVGRLSDWRWVVFAPRGLLACVAGADDVREVMLLPTPVTLDKALADLPKEASTIREYEDPAGGKPVVVEFGTVDIKIQLRGITLPKDEEDNLRSSLKQATGRGCLKYVEGAAGTYALSIEGQWDPKNGGGITIACSIKGNCVYGEVSGADGYEHANLPQANADSRVADFSGSLAYGVLLSQARQKAEQALREDIASHRPPDPEQMLVRARQEQAARLVGAIAAARKAAPAH